MNRRELLKTFGTAAFCAYGSRLALPVGDDDQVPQEISLDSITGADEILRFMAAPVPRLSQSALYTIGLRSRTSGVKLIEWNCNALLPFEWIAAPWERIVVTLSGAVYCSREDVPWALVYRHAPGDVVRVIAGSGSRWSANPL